MKKLLVVAAVFFLVGCNTLKTAYDVSRFTVEVAETDVFYLSGPLINRCKLIFDASTADFIMWINDQPAGNYAVDESGTKFRLHYQDSLDDEERHIILTKKYLIDHIKSGLCFRQDRKEYIIPGFYVEGFLNRTPSWVQ